MKICAIYWDAEGWIRVNLERITIIWINGYFFHSVSKKRYWLGSGINQSWTSGVTPMLEVQVWKPPEVYRAMGLDHIIQG